MALDFHYTPNKGTILLLLMNDDMVIANSPLPLLSNTQQVLKILAGSPHRGAPFLNQGEEVKKALSPSICIQYAPPKIECGSSLSLKSAAPDPNRLLHID
ncbi:hypothetical protein L1887_14847 [Cichorium endivia]|nr:hypothetical protein L1887_14847 [Cichorium endivia]